MGHTAAQALRYRRLLPGRLYADRRPWRYGCLDDLLRAVADETLVEVFITDTELRRN